MLDLKKFVLNALAGIYRKFLRMAVKKFGNFTRPIEQAFKNSFRGHLFAQIYLCFQLKKMLSPDNEIYNLNKIVFW